MKYGTTLITDRLFIRPWNLGESDRQVFHELNSDIKIMQYFPFLRTRDMADEVLEKIIKIAKKDGYGWSAICLRDTEKPIGFIGLSKVNFKARFAPATEIGWRIVPRHWRKGYALEAASVLVQHGFEDLKLNEIVAFAVPENIASTGLMQRLGMRAHPDMDFDMPGIDDDHAHLRRHVFYRLQKNEFKCYTKGN